MNHQEVYANNRGMEKINDHLLYWESYGQSMKPPLVFLHHGLGSTRSWTGQISFFLEAGYKVFVYDRRGFGRSEYYAGYSAPDFLGDLDDLASIVQVHLNIPVILIGHSDGGTIACLYASRHPKFVCCLVSVAAHIYVEEKMETGIRSVKTLFDQDIRFRDGLRRVHSDKYSQVFSNWYNGWLRPENRKWTITSDIRIISCAAMIVQGIDDEHASPKHAQDIADLIPAAELWLAPGGNHMLPQELSDQFNPRVLGFLERKCLIKS